MIFIRLERRQVHYNLFCGTILALGSEEQKSDLSQTGDDALSDGNVGGLTAEVG